MSALAVIGDALLIPFFPQVFAARFDATSPNVTGLYLAAVCFVVMAALPLWARLARRVHPLRVLVVAQPCAALLALATAAAPSLAVFCVFSLAMFACKASYLLMYPYVLGLEHDEAQADTIGLLSVVVHFGAIFGALVGGATLQLLDVSDVFRLMAVSDVAQVAIVWPLARAGHGPATEDPPQPKAATDRRFGRLLAMMGIVYFGAFLSRPFFGVWWAQVSGVASPLLAGAVFAVPAFVALAGLAINRRRRLVSAALAERLPGVLALGATGLLLQAWPHVAAIVAGRCVYGWSIFQATVALDAMLFAASTPDRYATDYGKANIAQNVGVIVAAMTAGALVATAGLAAPFVVAAGAFGASGLLARRPSSRRVPLSPFAQKP